MALDIPQKNLESAIKLYDDLQQVTKKAGKQAEFLQMSIKLKVTKELLDSVNDDLKGLYNRVVDKTQNNNEGDTTPEDVSGDITDSKFINLHKENNVRKTAKVAKKVDKKTDRIDQIIKNKTGLNGVDGLIAAVHQLNHEVRSQYPELFGSVYFNEAKKEAEKLIESGTLDSDKIKAQYEQEIKKGKSPESAAKTILTDAYQRSTNFLVEKANFDPGIAQATVIGLAIWGVLKGYPAVRGVFPNGLGGFLLMGLTAYAAAKNIPGDKVLKTYEGIFGEVPGGKSRGGLNNLASRPELSYMSLESSEFQNGQLFFSGLTKHLKDPKDDWIMKTYYVMNSTGGKSFNIQQFVIDYEAGAMGYDGPKPDKLNTELRQKFKITGQSDTFMGFLAGRVDGPNGSNTVSREIDNFLAGIVGGSYGTSDLKSVKSVVDQYGTYAEINQKRYQILKNSGYEIDLSQGDKRKLVDQAIHQAIGKDLANLSADYRFTDNEKRSLGTLIDDLVLTAVITESTEIESTDSSTIDKLLAKGFISLKNNEKATLNKFKQAFAREDSKYSGGMKFSLLEIEDGEKSVYNTMIDIEGIGQFPVTVAGGSMSLGFAANFDSDFVPKAARGLEFTDPEKFFEMVGLMITTIMPMRNKSKISSAISKKEGQNTVEYFSTSSMRGLTFKKDHSMRQNALVDDVLVKDAILKKLFSNSETSSLFVDWLNTNFMMGELPIWDMQAADVEYFYSGNQISNTSAVLADRDQTAGEKVKNSLQEGVDYALDIGSIVGSGVKKGLIGALEGTGDVGKKIVRELGELMGVGLDEINKMIPQGFQVVNSVIGELGQVFNKMSDDTMNGFMGGLGRLLKSGVITIGSTADQIMQELGKVGGSAFDEVKEIFAKHGLQKGGGALLGHLALGIIAYRFTKYGFKQSAGEGK